MSRAIFVHSGWSDTPWKAENALFQNLYRSLIVVKYSRKTISPFLPHSGHIGMKCNILVVTRLKSWGPDLEILLANFNKKIFLVQIKIRKRRFHSEFDSEWNCRVRILIFFRIFEYWARSGSIWLPVYFRQNNSRCAPFLLYCYIEQC